MLKPETWVLTSWRLSIAALLSTLAAGCAHQRPAAAPLDLQQVRSYEASGYPASGPYATGSARQVWTLQGQAVEVLWTLPTHAGQHPLVIYLPGLGQTADAGARWREAWSHAGYAVLSVQPLAADAHARLGNDHMAPPGEMGSSEQPGPPADSPPSKPPSDSARRRGKVDTFDPLAKERFAGNAVQQRLNIMDQLLREATARAARGDPVLSQIDLTRTAVAGFDLGAYTTMVLAGERVAGVSLPAAPLQPRAYLAISPYANFSDSGFDTRYQAIYPPVLSITADGDTDPNGLVSGSYLRVAPFNGMPTGDKYMLVLLDGSHALLGGNHIESGPGDEMANQDGPQEHAGNDRGGQRSGKPSGSRGGGPGGSSLGAPDPMTGANPAAISRTERALRQVAAESVSVAFLDAHLRDDPIAREWLARDATRWLSRRAELQVK